MDFALSQEIHAPLWAVEQALGDVRYYQAFTSGSSSVQAPELLDVSTSEYILALRVRYAFAGQLSGAARMAVDAEKLTWVIETHLDLQTHRARLDVIPDHYDDLLRCEAEVVFTEHGEHTIELLEGSLNVSVPFFGGTIEQAIIEGLKEHVAMEAAALAGFCSST